ncbi:MAG: phosphatase PAP2 family protein [Candidatus Aminicenantes bacterium]|nr:phosphatase PAP2 family protein [Candidatus Aminicenantes bacterium]
MKSLIASLAPVLTWDIGLFRFINSHHSRIFDAFFWGCSTFGSAWVIVPIYFAFIVIISERRRVLTVFIASVATLITGAVLVEAIKSGVDRPRPPAYFEAAGGQATADGRAGAVVDNKSGGRGSFMVHNVGPALRSRSFPSGHSWVSFEIATLLALFFGRRFRWVYLAAAAIAYSRIYVGVHFPLDVLGGAIGGTLLALLAWRVTAWIAPDHRLRPRDPHRRRLRRLR